MKDQSSSGTVQTSRATKSSRQTQPRPWHLCRRRAYWSRPPRARGLKLDSLAPAPFLYTILISAGPDLTPPLYDSSYG